jgi:hypothetical protein
MWRVSISPASPTKICTSGETPIAAREIAVLRSILTNGFREHNVAFIQIEVGFGAGAEDFGAGVVELAFWKRKN